MQPRLAIFRSLLSTFPPGHLLDLACGHGLFSVAARELGWEVTGVDARTERWPDEPGIDWVESDVRAFEIGGAYDVIAVLGLLYHLELDDQLDLLRRCAHRPTIVDTHVSLKGDREVRGYEGHYFEEDLQAPTAAWGNERSFWPTEPSLVRMFYDAGFGSVSKHVPPHAPDRTFWLCLPAGDDEDSSGWRQLVRTGATPAPEEAKQLAGLRRELQRLRRESDALAQGPVSRVVRSIRRRLDR